MREKGSSKPAHCRLVRVRQRKKIGERIEAVETEDTMTDRQIAAKVQDYLQN
jgi:hypothetical protein